MRVMITGTLFWAQFVFNPMLKIKLNPVLQIVSGDETIDWTPLIKSPYKLEGDSVQFCLLCCGYGFARTRVVGVWPAPLLASVFGF